MVMDAEVSLAAVGVTMAIDPNKLSLLRILPDYLSIGFNEHWGAELTCPVLSPTRQLITEVEKDSEMSF